MTISAQHPNDTRSAYPFSVSSDIDLGGRVGGAAMASVADVAVREGEVPVSIEATVTGVAFQLRRDEFLLTVPDGSRILVREGREVIYQRGPETGDRDILLFILGSAWGALCYQRGLIPIHASACLANEKIVAFTGVSGAGKSTLAANLAKRGFAFFTDDTLIFDPTISDSHAMCFAGQKQLKLWRDAIEATGAEKLQPVREATSIDKHFAVPPRPSDITLAPLERLFLLKRARGDAQQDNLISDLKGADALQAIRRNLYRPTYAEGLLGRKDLFLALKHLTETVKLFEFTRTVSAENYDASIEFMIEAIGSKPSVTA